jgi:MFS family permease
MAALLLELTLTRIFSVIFFYHYAFLAISVAMFGLGAGGVFSYVVAGWRGNLYEKLGRLGIAASVSILLSLIFLLTRTGRTSYVTLFLLYFLSALPFLFAGALVSLVISETIERIERVYFFDLLGAAAGCLALIPLLNLFGGPNTVIVVAVLFSVTSAIWYGLDKNVSGRATAVAIALGLAGLLVVNIKYNWLDVRNAKGAILENERFVKWNSFSRIAVATEKGMKSLSVVIDGDASTGIAQFDFDSLSDADREMLLRSGPGLPYRLRPGAKTLVIGPGGGWDISRALASGSKDVTGVEINPIIATTVMQDKFADYSKRIYFRPEIRMFVEDGRSFVRRSAERYQVMQATLVDTWASTAAGAFSLSENNLYTSDAFHDYLSHLTDDGILAFTRWGFDPPRESLRVVALAIEALKQLGENSPDRHLLVVREGTQRIGEWGATDTVIVSRKPMSDRDLAKVLEATKQPGMEVVYAPGTSLDTPFRDLLTAKDKAAFFAGYRYDVSPVNDNRPFFFYTVQPKDLIEYLRSATKESADFKINTAVPMLFGVLFVSLAATAVTLLLPPLLLKQALPANPKVRAYLLYFCCLGAGYIMIQVALIQKFVLLLGHPTYALTVIIFTMLLSSGLGSNFSKRIVQGSSERARLVLLAVVFLVPVLGYFAGLISSVGPAWPLPLKMMATVIIVAPLGFLMGIPFPTGLAALEIWESSAVRWAWSMNAASSVLGSALAIFLAIYLGLYQTLVVGGLLYLAAAWIYRSTAEKAAPAA